VASVIGFDSQSHPKSLSKCRNTKQPLLKKFWFVYGARMCLMVYIRIKITKYINGVINGIYYFKRVNEW